MIRIALLALFWPALAWGQSLTGSYVFEGPQGSVELVLEHSGSRVAGTMTGVDGNVSRLEGTFDGQKATGTIAVAGGSGWFAAGFLEGGLTLLVAEVDADTGEPDLGSGWRIDFVRAGADGTGSRAGSGAARGAADRQVADRRAGAGRAAAPTSSSPLVREWMQHLRGKKVSYRSSYSSNDASGYGGYSDRWDAYLCSDGTFHYSGASSVSVDVGGAWGSSGGGDSLRGQWRIVEQGGQAVLQYQSREQAGTEQGEWVPLSYQDGKTFFGSNRVFVTDQNDVCS